MTLDDESVLSAYLDEALTPEQRLRVEAAVRSSPALADCLRELATVRDLVAGLSRPSPGIDVSATVLTSIGRRRAGGRSWQVFHQGGLLATRGGRAAVLLATAAALLVVALATVVSRRLPRTVDGDGARGLVVQRDVLEGPAPVPVAPAPGPAVSAGPAVVASRPTILGPGLDERLRDQRRQNVRRLLDSPNLRSVYYITGPARGETARHVRELLGQLPRKVSNFVQLDLGTEALVDPDRPGEATIFAVVVDAAERQAVRDRLRHEYLFQFDEGTPRPEMLTLLAEVGRESVLSGTAVADIRVPDGPAPALRRHDTPTIPLGPLPSDPGTDWLSGLLPSPSDSRVEANRPTAASAPRPAPSVLLIWITSPLDQAETAPAPVPTVPSARP